MNSIMPKMQTFNLGLMLAGETQFVLSIMEEDIHKAKCEWARVTGHLDPNWNNDTETYYDWPVIQTKQKALPRKTGNEI